MIGQQQISHVPVPGRSDLSASRIPHAPASFGTLRWPGTSVGKWQAIAGSYQLLTIALDDTMGTTGCWQNNLGEVDC